MHDREKGGRNVKLFCLAALLAYLLVGQTDKSDIKAWQKQALATVTMKPGDTPGVVVEKKFGDWKKIKTLCFLNLKSGIWYGSRDLHDPVWKTVPPGQYAILDCSGVAGQ
jgi:hypothetical protein